MDKKDENLNQIKIRELKELLKSKDDRLQELESEIQIEAAKERVRARAMTMHHSDELSEVLSILFSQFDILGIKPVFAHLTLFDETNDHFSFRMTGTSGERVVYKQIINIHTRPEWTVAYENFINSEPNVISCIEYPPEILPQIWEIFEEIFSQLPEGSTMQYEDFPDGLYTTQGHCQFGYLGFNHTRQATEEEKEIVRRFANEFGRVYQRFLDLQKAEAQARESQIETALERVRSRAMAMQQSDELAETSTVLFEQMKDLGIQARRVGFALVKDDGKIEIWSTVRKQDGSAQLLLGYIYNHQHPLLAKIVESYKKNEESYFDELHGFELKAYYQAIQKTLDFSDEMKFVVDQASSEYYHLYNFGDGLIYAFAESAFSEEGNRILKRFTQAFGLIYRRFLDLKKAEAQAREAQLEAAIEKVRATSLAMHRSYQFSDVTGVLFSQFQDLGLKPNITSISILHEAKGIVESWICSYSQDDSVFYVEIPLESEPHLQDSLSKWKAGAEFNRQVMDDRESIRTMRESYARITKNKRYIEGKMPSYTEQVEACHKYGSLGMICEEPIPEEDIRVLIRFATVFEQSYTRFLDLQKTEEQAREAQIEAALERVRTKAMAMNSSEDLSSTVSTIFTELNKLDLNPMRCGLGLIDEKSKIVQLYVTGENVQEEKLELVARLKLDGHPILDGIFKAFIDQAEYHPILKGELLTSYYNMLEPYMEVPVPPDDFVQYGHFFTFSDGGLYAWTDRKLTDNEMNVYRKFTSVLALSYRRYEDLKEAEARARDAIQKASLDRVRAEIASMRTAKDLERITPLIWSELTTLNVPFFRCGVFIINEESQKVQVFLSTPDGKAIAALDLTFDTNNLTTSAVQAWKNNTLYKESWDRKQFIEWTKDMIDQGLIEDQQKYQQSAKAPEKLVLQFLPFSQGMLYVGSSEALTESQIEIVQSLANTFSVAYARYQDFEKLERAKTEVEKALNDLKAAQAQLIHAEKMASLGELTAGIAHEIQNPLNFVNNFSEVTRELIKELKEELESGQTGESKEILEDIMQNLEKINHHGCRASSIVKGMLDHSRTGSRDKVETDINRLADEYLRLAYHGMRAKDRSFNASFESDFDEDIPRIKIVQQDIGRVFLNLINNAFQACLERSQDTLETINQQGNKETYQPLVSVKTSFKRSDSAAGPLNSFIQITIADNGPGISNDIKDKIFQPFFTTKPTGQGTGLGLSLSYDIVKAHAGKLSVESEKGKGSEFILHLPCS